MNRPKMPQQRRNEIKVAVLDLLYWARVDDLPVNLRAILRTIGVHCVTAAFAEAYGIKLNGTDDGYTIARPVPGGVQYMIVYNDQQIQQRVRWTIAHEIGHIVLGHVDGRVMDGDIEAEANYFARELLAPLAVLDELGARSTEAIAAACGLSAEAAAIRAADFSRRDAYKAQHGNTTHDLRFLRQFSKAFDSEIAGELFPFVA